MKTARKPSRRAFGIAPLDAVRNTPRRRRWQHACKGVAADCCDDVSLPDIPSIPGMTTANEGRFLYRLTNRQYTGRGAIVEIGTWLGRSSAHLAAGLRDSGLPGVVRCYDHFQWAGGANWHAKSGIMREPGSDFMPDFLAHTAPFADRIDAKRSTVTKLEFDPGPIELLVVDAPKRTKDVAALLAKLSPHVMPGVTVMAWQDFMHSASFEIPACLSSLTDHLEPLRPVEVGSLAAFRIRRPWRPRDVAADRLDFHHWSPVRAVAEWEAWKPFVPDDLWPSFLSGLAMLLHDNGSIGTANDILEEVKDDPLVKARWQRWCRTSLANRYAPLFDHMTAIGAIGPDVDMWPIGEEEAGD
ncbi:MAG: class I SAM-dependent methyltransferase [Azospirillaceae bacterium]